MALSTFAQDSKYKRAKKPSVDPVTAAASPAPNASGKDDKSKKDEKVDVKEIENQYWSSKDTEFHVVQNRRYTKDKRVFASVEFGSLIGDSYTKGNAYSLDVGYFFNEQSGVQLMYTDYVVQATDAVYTYRNLGGTAVGLNFPTSYVGAGYVWMPIYAKLSLLEKKIIYFDMAFTPSIGATSVSQQQLSGAIAAGPYMTFGFDVSQHFYLDEHFAIRLDFKTRWYTQTVKPYVSGASADQTSSITNQSLNLGIVYWY